MQIKKVVNQINEAPDIFVSQRIKSFRHEDIHNFDDVKVYFDVTRFRRYFLKILEYLAWNKVNVLGFLVELL